MNINLKKIILFCGFILFLSGIASARPNTKICRKRNGKFPMPGTLCKRYYECKNFVPEEKTCKDGEHFNANKEWCDWEELYPCLEKVKDKECLRQNGLFLKPGTECKKYYRCCNGKAQEETCPGDSLFDPSKENCEWPDLYTCIESLSTTEKVPSTVTTFATSTTPDDQKEKTATDPVVSTTTTQKTTSTEQITYSTQDPDSERTNSRISETTNKIITQPPPTDGQSIETSTISETITSTIAATLSTIEISTTSEPTTTESSTLQSTTEISTLPSTTEISSSESTTETSTLQTTSSEISIISQTVSPQMSSTHSTNHTISKENKEGEITEPTLFETTMEVTFSPSTEEVTTSDELNVKCPEPNGYFPHPTDKHKFISHVQKGQRLERNLQRTVSRTSFRRISIAQHTQSVKRYDSIKVSDRYKLILVSQNRPLPDESTIRDEEIRENDELLLLKRRHLIVPMGESQEEKEEKCRGPIESEIQKETSGIHPKNLDAVVENPSVPVDFHTELRKILVSLVKVSEKLLRYHPEVVALFKEMAEEEGKEDEPSVDKASLKQLTDMGFGESQAVESLRQNSNVSDAMDWLLAQSAHDVNAPVATPAAKTNSSPVHVRKFSVPKFSVSKLVDKCTSDKSSEKASSSDKSSASTSQKQDAEVPSTSQGTSAPSGEQSRIVEMIRCFRAYKRKVFRPSSAALANLKEMGFAEADILDALRINGNNQDTACDWLLSDKKPNFEDVEEGLDPDGPIYKSIMSNPVVQLGLSNPKTFLALLHMLENPTSACRWLSDPDTAPILSQIFRIYHAEKHSLQLARPFPQIDPLVFYIC
ncbi:Ubiquitin-associated domain-containing [Argiope bruennichi]|uniref:Ubiquitin-associated domain-containing n=1 Tax=Argiope bruennichi TaxID=94029 RepID=A0A8T0EWJ5_ARGBR|nr:Ubiquitin-associated domain-containing [Argiope bruennichi]